MRRKPKGVTRMLFLSLSCNSTRHARDSCGLLSQGYCEQKTLNLESVLSDILINLYVSESKKISFIGRTYEVTDARFY